MRGTLEAIWIKSRERGLMERVRCVRTVAGSGLVGNSDQGGRRQVTLLSAEAWEDVEAELGRALDPVLRRANLLVRGIDLEESRGRTLLVGRVPILLRGETRPCRLMEEACPGLRAALSARWRGGAYGEVLDGGELMLGDPVRWLERPASTEDVRG